MRDSYSRSVRMSSHFGENSDSRRTHTTDRGHWPAALVILAAIPLTGMSFLMWREYHPHYPPLPTEYGDVRLLEKLDIQGYSWRAEKADGPFRVDFCHDYPVPALNFQPGEVAWRFWFKDTGSCWSIRDGDIRFYRDPKTFWTIATDVRDSYESAMIQVRYYPPQVPSLYKEKQ